MPCRGDYLEPTEREKESKHVCKLLKYVFKCIGKNVPEDVRDAVNDYYGNDELLDDHIAMLCKLCSSMSETQKNMFIYDGRNPMARKLADWWDRHQEVDKRRKDEEKNEKKLKKIRQGALKKLTKTEKEALGL